MKQNPSHTFHRHFLLGAAAWLLGCASTLQAQTKENAQLQLSIMDQKPQHTSLPGYYDADAKTSGYQWVRASELRRDVGQSLTMRKNAEISAISIHSQGNVQTEAYEEAFQLELWESGRVDQLGERVKIWEGTWFPRGTRTGNKWIRFGFPSVSMKQGFYYTFLLRWKNEGPRHVFTVTTEAIFADGRRWQSGDGETHTSTQSHALFFQLEPAGE